MPFDLLPPTTTIRERDLLVLRRVRDALNAPDSWARGIYDLGHRHCAVGWMQLFANGGNQIERIAALYIQPVLPWRWRLFDRRPISATDAIIMFNDRQTRKEKVVTMFERAIAGRTYGGKAMMQIIVAVIIGFLAGLIAKWIMPGPNEPQGFILTTILGIIGSVVATFLGRLVGWYGPDFSAGFIASIVGAIIVLAIWQQVVSRRAL